MSQIKKLSVATVYGKIKLADLMAKKQFPLMKVYGSAVSVKKGLSSFGEWQALQGQFKAVNSDTGEISEAATLFLPDVALIPIQVALSAPGANAVEFAIEIQVKFSEESQTKYEYSWAPLLPPSSDDPIARLEAKMQALLPAPAPAVEPVAEPEAEVEAPKHRARK